MNKIYSIAELYSILPENERMITDVLRQIILAFSPEYIKEKISFQVPFFYGKKGICIVWPASIPGGGIKKGVLLGFWNGRFLKDKDNYLTKGSNKKVYYRIYTTIEEIDDKAILQLLNEAVEFDSKA